MHLLATRELNTKILHQISYTLYSGVVMADTVPK